MVNTHAGECEDIMWPFRANSASQFFRRCEQDNLEYFRMALAICSVSLFHHILFLILKFNSIFPIISSLIFFFFFN